MIICINFSVTVKSNILSWKKRLTIDEIEKIKEKTHIIASKFYTEEDWTE